MKTQRSNAVKKSTSSKPTTSKPTTSRKATPLKTSKTKKTSIKEVKSAKRQVTGTKITSGKKEIPNQERITSKTKDSKESTSQIWIRAPKEQIPIYRKASKGPLTKKTNKNAETYTIDVPPVKKPKNGK